MMILVDLQFRRKVRALITRGELYIAILFLVFALINWAEVMRFFSAGSADDVLAQHAADHDPIVAGVQAGEEGLESHCSPKFPKACVVEEP